MPLSPLAEIVAICSISSFVEIGCVLLPSSKTIWEIAKSIPLLSSTGLAFVAK